MERGIEPWAQSSLSWRKVEGRAPAKEQLVLLEELQQGKSRYATSWRNIFELHDKETFESLKNTRAGAQVDTIQPHDVTTMPC